MSARAGLGLLPSFLTVLAGGAPASPGRQSPSGPVAPSREGLLRMVLVLTLDRETATDCLGARDPAGLWPSTVHGQLAAAATRCAAVWERCARAVEARLATPTHPYDGQPADEIARLLGEVRDFLSESELAAILWSLLRRQSLSHYPSAEAAGVERDIVPARQPPASARRTP